MSGFETREIGELTAAVCRVMEAVGYIERTGQNNFHRYKYASDADLLKRIQPEMAKNGLMMIPIGIANTAETVTKASSEGREVKVQLRTTLLVKYLLAHTSGQCAVIEVPGMGMDGEDKSAYKAMTGALKYALRQTFMIPTGDDPERDENQRRTRGAQVSEKRQQAREAAGKLFQHEQLRSYYEQRIGPGYEAYVYQDALVDDLRNHKLSVFQVTADFIWSQINGDAKLPPEQRQRAQELREQVRPSQPAPGKVQQLPPSRTAKNPPADKESKSDKLAAEAAEVSDLIRENLQAGFLTTEEEADFTAALNEAFKAKDSSAILTVKVDLLESAGKRKAAKAALPPAPQNAPAGSAPGKYPAQPLPAELTEALNILNLAVDNGLMEVSKAVEFRGKMMEAYEKRQDKTLKTLIDAVMLAAKRRTNGKVAGKTEPAKLIPFAQSALESIERANLGEAMTEKLRRKIAEASEKKDLDYLGDLITQYHQPAAPPQNGNGAAPAQPQQDDEDPGPSDTDAPPAGDDEDGAAPTGSGSLGALWTEDFGWDDEGKRMINSVLTLLRASGQALSKSEIVQNATHPDVERNWTDVIDTIVNGMHAAEMLGAGRGAKYQLRADLMPSRELQELFRRLDTMLSEAEEQNRLTPELATQYGEQLDAAFDANDESAMRQVEARIRIAGSATGASRAERRR